MAPAPRPRVSVGTRSLLAGAHQVLLHPLWLAAAWTREFGFPRDPRLWVAFFVHDLGYAGKRDMNGPEGERHPELGARLMRRWFGAAWGDFTLFHSRQYAERAGQPVSALARADKRVIVMEPTFLYLPRVMATGELYEYMGHRPAGGVLARWRAGAAWHRKLRAETAEWLDAHALGGAIAAPAATPTQPVVRDAHPAPAVPRVHPTAPAAAGAERVAPAPIARPAPRAPAVPLP